MIERGGHSLLIGAVTQVVPNRVASINNLKRLIKRDGYTYAATCVSYDKTKIQASWGDSKDLLHFAGGVYRGLASFESLDYLFIEEVGAGSYAYVRVDEGVIISEDIRFSATIGILLSDIKSADESSQRERQVFLLNVTDAEVRREAGECGVITDVDATFWDDVLKKHAQAMRFRPIHDAVKGKGVRRPRTALVWGGVAAAATAYLVYASFYEPEVIEVMMPPPPDHFANYRSEVTRTQISPTNRLKEDFNLLLLTRQIPGWELVSVEHMRDVVSYNVRPILGIQGTNTVANLREFARKNGLQVARIDNNYALLYDPQNIPVYSSGYDYIHSVEHITDLFIDAVRLWIPGTQVVVHNDTPQSGGRWRSRRVSVAFSSHHREDLLTLSAIIESLELPIALISGQYQVRGEQITGEYSLSIIGD